MDARLEAVTIGVRDVNCNTVISIPSASGKGVVSVGVPGKRCYVSDTTRLENRLRKSDAMPELFNLKLVEANYKGDPQMRVVEELVEAKDQEVERKIRAMGAYLRQVTDNFHVRENCFWVDERLVIPIPLRKAVVNRIHCFQHGRANMFDAATDVWLPCIHRSLVAAADECKECPEAGKILKLMCTKEDIGKI